MASAIPSTKHTHMDILRKLCGIYGSMLQGRVYVVKAHKVNLSCAFRINLANEEPFIHQEHLYHMFCDTEKHQQKGNNGAY